MIKLINEEVYLLNGEMLSLDGLMRKNITASDIANSYKGTISYRIIDSHNTTGRTEKGKPVKIKFDALASHDITYVGIIQTAKASGLKEFPLPYVLTNCHNSLCAVGGTINEDDHVFGLSAAKKYGGIYVPAHQAVIHTYMRERMAGAGKMILGSDSHTRYGALGTMAVGEGGPELVKQLLLMTYDIDYPDVIAIILNGKPRCGVGPQDVALAIIKAVFKSGFVKNKVMEFVGSGISSLSAEYRNGIDVMTTETTCLSSIWATDSKIKRYYETMGRAEDYKELRPDSLARYDGAVIVDLDKVEPQIAMPFHPSNAYNLKDVILNPSDILAEVEREGNKLFKDSGVKLDLLSKISNGKINVQQGIIAGCAGGTFDNIYAAAQIMKGHSEGSGEFTMSVYPGSQPVYLDLVKKGAIAELIKSGVIVKTAFCGPCFGAGDVPSNNGLSIRHTTRNFESREGAKPKDGQIAGVALMDARSIAATAMNGGILTSAMDVTYDDSVPAFEYDPSVYDRRIFNGYNAGQAEDSLRYAPSIVDWPVIPELKDNLILKTVAVINDPVTTTDELIPSGETSSYRSNPMRLAEFTLSRKVPSYVTDAKKVKAEAEKNELLPEYEEAIKTAYGTINGGFNLGSVIFAVKPGDGSAREQAASSQRVLGGAANIAREYATKRYRSNLINWGMLPLVNLDIIINKGDIIIIPNVRKLIESGVSELPARIVSEGAIKDTVFSIGSLTGEEREIILAGCLMNYYKKLNEVKK
jgi:aconitate hydratase